MGKRGRTSVARFCGWDGLTKFLSKCDTPIKGALFATLFETGCRISEALQLHSDMLIDEGERIVAYGVPVLKKRKVSVRNIPMPKHEKLVSPMMNWVEEKEGLLFEGINRYQAYTMINGVDSRWWCHRIRSERATQLVVEYGFNIAELMKFFNWSQPSVAIGYVRLSVEDIRYKMVKKSTRVI